MNRLGGNLSVDVQAIMRERQSCLLLTCIGKRLESATFLMGRRNFTQALRTERESQRSLGFSDGFYVRFMWKLTLCR